MVPEVRGHIRHAQPLARRQRHSLQEEVSSSALQVLCCKIVSPSQQQSGLHALPFQYSTEEMRLNLKRQWLAQWALSPGGVSGRAAACRRR